MSHSTLSNRQAPNESSPLLLNPEQQKALLRESDHNISCLRMAFQQESTELMRAEAYHQEIQAGQDAPVLRQQIQSDVERVKEKLFMGDPHEQVGFGD